MSLSSPPTRRVRVSPPSSPAGVVSSSSSIDDALNVLRQRLSSLRPPPPPPPPASSSSSPYHETQQQNRATSTASTSMSNGGTVFPKQTTTPFPQHHPHRHTSPSFASGYRYWQVEDTLRRVGKNGTTLNTSATYRSRSNPAATTTTVRQHTPPPPQQQARSTSSASQHNNNNYSSTTTTHSRSQQQRKYYQPSEAYQRVSLEGEQRRLDSQLEKESAMRRSLTGAIFHQNKQYQPNQRSGGSKMSIRAVSAPIHHQSKTSRASSSGDGTMFGNRISTPLYRSTTTSESATRQQRSDNHNPTHTSTTSASTSHLMSFQEMDDDAVSAEASAAELALKKEWGLFGGSGGHRHAIPFVRSGSSPSSPRRFCPPSIHPAQYNRASSSSSSANIRTSQQHHIHLSGNRDHHIPPQHAFIAAAATPLSYNNTTPKNMPTPAAPISSGASSLNATPKPLPSPPRPTIAARQHHPDAAVAIRSSSITQPTPSVMYTTGSTTSSVILERKSTSEWEENPGGRRIITHTKGDSTLCVDGSEEDEDEGIVSRSTISLSSVNDEPPTTDDDNDDKSNNRSTTETLPQAMQRHLTATTANTALTAGRSGWNPVAQSDEDTSSVLFSDEQQEDRDVRVRTTNTSVAVPRLAEDANVRKGVVLSTNATVYEQRWLGLNPSECGRMVVASGRKHEEGREEAALISVAAELLQTSVPPSSSGTHLHQNPLATPLANTASSSNQHNNNNTHCHEVVDDMYDEGGYTATAAVVDYKNKYMGAVVSPPPRDDGGSMMNEDGHGGENKGLVGKYDDVGRSNSYSSPSDPQNNATRGTSPSVSAQRQQQHYTPSLSKWEVVSEAQQLRMLPTRHFFAAPPLLKKRAAIVSTTTASRSKSPSTPPNLSMSGRPTSPRPITPKKYPDYYTCGMPRQRTPPRRAASSKALLRYEKGWDPYIKRAGSTISRRISTATTTAPFATTSAGERNSIKHPPIGCSRRVSSAAPGSPTMATRGPTRANSYVGPPLHLHNSDDGESGSGHMKAPPVAGATSPSSLFLQKKLQSPPPARGGTSSTPSSPQHHPTSTPTFSPVLFQLEASLALVLHCCGSDDGDDSVEATTQNTNNTSKTSATKALSKRQIKMVQQKRLMSSLDAFSPSVLALLRRSLLFGSVMGLQRHAGSRRAACSLDVVEWVRSGTISNAALQAELINACAPLLRGPNPPLLASDISDHYARVNRRKFRGGGGENNGEVAEGGEEPPAFSYWTSSMSFLQQHDFNSENSTSAASSSSSSRWSSAWEVTACVRWLDKCSPTAIRQALASFAAASFSSSSSCVHPLHHPYASFLFEIPPSHIYNESNEKREQPPPPLRQTANGSVEAALMRQLLSTIGKPLFNASMHVVDNGLRGSMLPQHQQPSPLLYPSGDRGQDKSSGADDGREELSAALSPSISGKYDAGVVPASRVLDWDDTSVGGAGDKTSGGKEDGVLGAKKLPVSPQAITPSSTRSHTPSPQPMHGVASRVLGGAVQLWWAEQVSAQTTNKTTTTTSLPQHYTHMIAALYFGVSMKAAATPAATPTTIPRTEVAEVDEEVAPEGNDEAPPPSGAPLLGGDVRFSDTLFHRCFQAAIPHLLQQRNGTTTTTTMENDIKKSEEEEREEALIIRFLALCEVIKMYVDPSSPANPLPGNNMPLLRTASSSSSASSSTQALADWTFSRSTTSVIRNGAPSSPTPRRNDGDGGSHDVIRENSRTTILSTWRSVIDMCCVGRKGVKEVRGGGEGTPSSSTIVSSPARRHALLTVAIPFTAVYLLLTDADATTAYHNK